MKEGDIIGKNKLKKQIKKLDDLYYYLQNNKSIFHKHKLYPSAFIINWSIRKIYNSIISQWFYDYEKIEKEKKKKDIISKYSYTNYNKNEHLIKCNFCNNFIEITNEKKNNIIKCDTCKSKFKILFISDIYDDDDSISEFYKITLEILKNGKEK